MSDVYFVLIAFMDKAYHTSFLIPGSAMAHS
jgi:hypothetical protein